MILKESAGDRAFELTVRDKRSGAEWDFNAKDTYGFVSCVMTRTPRSILPWDRSSERMAEAMRFGIALAEGCVRERSGGNGRGEFTDPPTRLAVSAYPKNSRGLFDRDYQKALESLGFELTYGSASMGFSSFPGPDDQRTENALKRMEEMREYGCSHQPGDRAEDTLGQGQDQGPSFHEGPPQGSMPPRMGTPSWEDPGLDGTMDVEAFFAQRLDAIRAQMGDHGPGLGMETRGNDRDSPDDR